MRWLHTAILLLLSCSACGQTTPATVAVIDGGQLRLVTTQQSTVAAALAQAEVAIGPGDELLLNGLPVAPDATMGSGSITLQVRRAVSVSVGGQDIRTAVRSVGEA